MRTKIASAIISRAYCNVYKLAAASDEVIQDADIDQLIKELDKQRLFSDEKRKKSEDEPNAPSGRVLTIGVPYIIGPRTRGLIRTGLGVVAGMSLRNIVVPRLFGEQIYAIARKNYPAAMVATFFASLPALYVGYVLGHDLGSVFINSLFLRRPKKIYVGTDENGSPIYINLYKGKESEVI